MVITTQRSLTILIAGTTYYIKLKGNLDAAVDARLTVSMIYDWYYFTDTDASGATVEAYVSNKTDGTPQETRVLKNGYVGVYAIDGTYGTPNNYFAYNGDLGGGLKGGIHTASVTSVDGVVQTASIFGKIRKINLNNLKQTVNSNLLKLIGLPSDGFTDQVDSDYFLQGVATGLDDDFLYGWYNKIFGLAKSEDEFFYLAGHQLVDEAALAFWAQLSVDSAVTANGAFALGEAGSTGGLILAGTGVGVSGGIVLEVGALASVGVGVAASVVSIGAGVMSNRALTMLYSTKTKMSSLPNYNAGNFRTKLTNSFGGPPYSFIKYDAHHVFPQKFKDFFKRAFGSSDTIHNPQYGTWWEISNHRSNAYAYNKDWETFTQDFPNATKQQVLNKGKELATKYEFNVNY